MDLAMEHRLTQQIDPSYRVAVVAIDDASVRSPELGRFPWPRSLLARLVTAIHEAGAAVIAIDLVFSERSHLALGETPRLCSIPDPDPDLCVLPDDDCQLAEAFARSGNVVSGYYLRDEFVEHREPFTPLQLHGFREEIGEGVELERVPNRIGVDSNLGCFDDSAAAHGFLTQSREQGVFRNYRLVIGYEGHFFPPLALTAAAEYVDKSLRLLPHQGSLPGIYLGDERIPADEAGTVRIDYLGGPRSLPCVSALSLLDPESTADPECNSPLETLEGALVFVGPTALGVGDLHPSPYDERMPGVEIHATVAYNLLAGRYIHEGTLQYVLSFLAVFALGLLVAQLVRQIPGRVLGSLAGVLAIVGWAILAFVIFAFGRWHVHFVAPMLAGAFSLVANLTYEMFWADLLHKLEESKRKQVELEKELQKKRLGIFIAPSVREEVLRDEQAMVPKEKIVTILFCDIRGFSRWSEQKPARVLVDMLSRFFDEMTHIVHAEGGTLDKYLGDGFMAFFGAPSDLADHAGRACKATLRMQARLSKLRQESMEGLAAEKPDFSDIKIGVGLNTGKATVGPTGSQDIKNYTVIGDDVNFASRVEGLTKAFQVENLVTKETWREAGDGFLFCPLGWQRPKGMEESERLFELVAEAPGTPEQQKRILHFEQGLEALFEQRDLSRADQIFGKLEKQYEDGPSRFYLAWIERHRTDFETWNGVIEHDEK